MPEETSARFPLACACDRGLIAVSHGERQSERLWCRTCGRNSYECFSCRGREEIMFTTALVLGMYEINIFTPCSDPLAANSF